MENFFKNDNHYKLDKQGHHLQRHILNQLEWKDDANIDIKEQNKRRQAQLLAMRLIDHKMEHIVATKEALIIKNG